MKKFYLTLGAAVMLALTSAADVAVPALHLARVSHQAKKAPATAALPYKQSFDDESSVDQVTIIDANDDDNTWTWEDDGMMGYFCDLFGDNAGDDWIVTPGLALEAGKQYEVSVKAGVMDEDSPERFEVMLGKEATAAAMTIRVIDPTTIDNETMQVFSATVTVSESGTYYLGVHCTSDADMMELYIDDIEVKEAAAGSVPAGVEELTVTPDPLGALKALVTFTTPSLAVDGTALESLDRVEIYRNDALVYTFAQPAVATQLQYNDESPVNGTNYYRVTAFNANGEGQAVQAVAFVGEDEPAPPANAQARGDASDVILTWENSSKGWNGQFVNIDSVYVTIYKTQDGITRSLVADNVYGNEYRIEGANASGAQAQWAYQIYPNNKAGRGQKANTNTIVTGQAYELPFKESVTELKTTYSFWSMDATSSSDHVYATNDAQDNDGGAFLLRFNAQGDTLALYTGKINVKEAQSLYLSFQRKGNSDNYVNVSVVRDGEVIGYLTSADDSSVADGWTQESYNLSDFAGEDYIQVGMNVHYAVADGDVLLDVITLTESDPSAIVEVVAPVENADTRIYTIDGKQLSGDMDSLPRGIYITGGKKVVK